MGCQLIAPQTTVCALGNSADGASAVLQQVADTWNSDYQYHFTVTGTQASAVSKFGYSTEACAVFINGD
jgi:hypothetical protein